MYRERLGVPLSWWLLTAACVLLLGTTLQAGLGPVIALLIYAGLAAGCALALLIWGAVVIEVGVDAVRAGARRLPLAQVGEVAALDKAQTAALRGPRADPAAFLLVRPWLAESVYLEVRGRPAEQPYWLVATRRPAALAAAVERARRPGHAGGDPVIRPASGAVG